MRRNPRKKAQDPKGTRASGAGAIQAQPVLSGEAPNRTVVMLKVADIKVDPKLKALVPRPGLPEWQALRESIQGLGVRDPIHVRASDLLAIDGHTRLDICKEQKREEIPAILEDVPDENLKEWVIKFAVERRQLSPWQLVKLAPPLLAIEKSKAHARVMAGVSPIDPGQKTADGSQIGRATAIVAKKLGLGARERLQQALAVLNSKRDDLIRRLDQGEITINRAWELLNVEEPKKSTVPPFKKCMGPLNELKEWNNSGHAKKHPELEDLERARQLLASLEEMARTLKSWTRAMRC